MNQPSRTIFFISDGTGITAESLGRSLLTQFPGFEFKFRRFPNIRDSDQTEKIVSEIRQAYENDKSQPIVFTTFVDSGIEKKIEATEAFVIDLFSYPMKQLEKKLDKKAIREGGQTHAMRVSTLYHTHMEAINYSVTADDGGHTHNYSEADLVVIGPSRSGKTPTCMYLATRFYLKAANYPITTGDLNQDPFVLPSVVTKGHHLVGFTIDPVELSKIRKARMRKVFKSDRSTKYASVEECHEEIEKIERMYKMEKIECINVTHISVPEIATKIMMMWGDLYHHIEN